MINTMLPQELLLIDGNSLVTASYFATKSADLRGPGGTPTGAITGFIRTLFSLFDRFPSHACVMFDKRARLLRKNIFEDYKAHRKPLEEDLVIQIPIVQEFLNIMRIPMFARDGYEADDIIASFAEEFHEEIPICVVSRDMDMLQLLNLSNVTVYLLRSGGNSELVTRTTSNAYFDVPYQQITLYKALVGDTSDNIPGVPGIGPVAAKELCTIYPTLTALINALNAGELPIKYDKKLRPCRDTLIRDYRLVNFMIMPIRIPSDDLARRPADEDALNKFYDTYGIRR